MIFLAGCGINPDRVIDVRYPKIPSVYLEKCGTDFKDSTIKSIITGLDETIDCYESKQESLKVWHKELTKDGDI